MKKPELKKYYQEILARASKGASATAEEMLEIIATIARDRVEKASDRLAAAQKVIDYLKEGTAKSDEYTKEEKQESSKLAKSVEEYLSDSVGGPAERDIS